MEDISGKAFAMFKDWTKNASVKHPGYVFDILDETLLVNDLTNTIKSAINSLKKEKYENRSLIGFDIGFMIGFIRSNLNMHWGYEYIVKQSENYKTFIALKAVASYLEFASLTTIRINAIYKYLLLQDSNISGPGINIEKQLFDAYKLNLIPNNKTDNVQIALENEIRRSLIQFLDEKTGDFLPNASKYFSKSEIEMILKPYS